MSKKWVHMLNVVHLNNRNSVSHYRYDATLDDSDDEVLNRYVTLDDSDDEVLASSSLENAVSTVLEPSLRLNPILAVRGSDGFTYFIPASDLYGSDGRILLNSFEQLRAKSVHTPVRFAPYTLVLSSNFSSVVELPENDSIISVRGSDGKVYRIYSTHFTMEDGTMADLSLKKLNDLTISDPTPFELSKYKDLVLVYVRGSDGMIYTIGCYNLFTQDGKIIELSIKKLMELSTVTGPTKYDSLKYVLDDSDRPLLYHLVGLSQENVLASNVQSTNIYSEALSLLSELLSQMASFFSSG